MSNKNTAVFGLYPDEIELSEGVAQLRRSGFRTTDFSLLLPENLGSKDIGHEKNTKAPEGAVIGSLAGAIFGGALAWLIHSSAITIPRVDASALILANPIIAVLAGAGAVAFLGAFLGAIFGAAQPEYEARRYTGRIRSGGILLSVHCDNADWRVRAKKALLDTGAKGVASAAECKGDFGSSEKPLPRQQGCEISRHKSFLRDAPVEEPPVATVLDSERYPLS